MSKILYAIAIALIALLGVIFAILNAETVQINYYFGSKQAPLSLAIILSMLLGAILGLFASLGLILKSKREVSDRIFRSYGTLESARIITSSETIKLLSAIRLGSDLGLIDKVDIERINEMFLLSQPAHLQKNSGKIIPPYERDIKRADLIRKILGVKDK